MATTHTACTLDCPDSCSLEVTTEAGKIAKIAAGSGNSLTGGFICSKVRRFDDLVYHDSRVQYPQRRIGAKGKGHFERISWDQALDTIAEQLKRVRDTVGGEAILPLCYGGSNGVLTQNTTDLRLFRRLGASNLRRTVCAAPSGAASAGLSGDMTGVALDDYEHARLIVVWGVNPSATGIHLVPVIQRAQKRGAQLVVIDPRRTPLAKKADLHLAPRPGSDLALALAVANHLFERDQHDAAFLDQHCTHVPEFRARAAQWSIDKAAEATGIAAADIEAFALLYSERNPAVIRCGWGVERNRNGGSAVASILALPAVAGKFGVRAGGYTMSNSAHWASDSRIRSAVLEDEPNTRSVNMNHVGRLLNTTHDKVNFLFVYNCNPLATLPHQSLMKRGLEREDLFTVVFDPVMTDTARYADIVLPATTFLEHEDLAKGYGAMVVHRSQPAIEAIGESRPNHEVFGDLLKRSHLHREGEPITGPELRDFILEDSAAGIMQGEPILPREGARPIQFVDTFPRTSEKKMDLVPVQLDQDATNSLYQFSPDPATEKYPLALLSPATSKTINSIMGQVRKLETIIELAPADAAARGLATNTKEALVRAFNDGGEVICRYRINADLMTGVTVMPKGAWLSSSENGATSNALVPDSLTDIGGGACFNDARIEVEAVAS